LKVLIIVPAYNEENAIVNVINDIKINIPTADIVVINDGSIDNTSEVAKKENVIVLDLVNNLGIGGAVQTGFLFAQKYDYDIAVQVDGDGQHPAEYIKQIIEPIQKKEANVVIGSRFLVKDNDSFKSSFFRRIGIRIISFVLKIFTKMNITDPTSGFRAFDKEAIRLNAEFYPDDYPEPEIIILFYKKQLKVNEVPIIMNSRQAGISSIGKFDSIYYMFKVIFAIILHSLEKRQNI